MSADLFYEDRRERTAVIREYLERIREERPVVQCITNIVTVNDCANALLAIGASPTMAHHLLEMQDFGAICDALVCNLGATESQESMVRAAALAVSFDHPAVLDPVGCAGSQFRRLKAMEILESGRITCIRGNAAEIRALVEHCNTGRGVDDLVGGAFEEKAEVQASLQAGLWANEQADSRADLQADLQSSLQADVQAGVQADLQADVQASKQVELQAGKQVDLQAGKQVGLQADEQAGNQARKNAGEYAAALARQTGAIVIASGETDYISDGEEILAVKGGSPMLARITGSGCMLSALLGAFLAVERSVQSAAACCALMADCGEQAEKWTREAGRGTGTFHLNLLDALSMA